MGQDNGKGDKMRKDMDLAKYRENYDKIFKKEEPESAEIDTSYGCGNCGCFECSHAKFKLRKGNKLND